MIENGFGEVIYVDRLLYKHFGVYCGGGRVIHYVKTEGDAFDGVIDETSIERFLDGSDCCRICRFDNLGRQLHGNAPSEPQSVLGCVLQLGEILFGDTATIYSPEETVARARSCIGQRNYDLFGRNCEHFAVWCKTGIAKSEQIETVEQGIFKFIEDAFVKSKFR